MENKHKQFNVFDKVLVRDAEEIWRIDFYSNWDDEYKQHLTLAFGNGLKIDDKDILPYEGNEHLLGTTDEPEEEIQVEYWEWIMASNICSDDPSAWYLEQCANIIKGEGSIETKKGRYFHYFIRFSNFNPSDMEETRKHILCVKNGKIVRCKE